MGASDTRSANPSPTGSCQSLQRDVVVPAARVPGAAGHGDPMPTARRAPRVLLEITCGEAVERHGDRRRRRSVPALTSTRANPTRRGGASGSGERRRRPARRRRRRARRCSRTTARTVSDDVVGDHLAVARARTWCTTRPKPNGNARRGAVARQVPPAVPAVVAERGGVAVERREVGLVGRDAERQSGRRVRRRRAGRRRDRGRPGSRRTTTARPPGTASIHSVDDHRAAGLDGDDRARVRRGDGADERDVGRRQAQRRRGRRRR